MQYKIKEVAERIGISAHAIRYYEKEGILPPIYRDKNGIRLFDDDNLYWLDLVTCLKNTNMPVSDIKRIVELSQKGDSTIEQRKAILKHHKKRIEEEIQALEQAKTKVQKKIDFYDGAGEC